MKRQLFFALSLTLAACGGGATAPDSDLAPLVSARFYDGTARFTRTTTAAGLVDVLAFVGNVRFVTADPGRPPVDYTMESGTMAVSHSQDLSGACRLEGHTAFQLGPGDGAIVLFPGPDARYSGRIQKTVTFTSTLSCPAIATVPFDDLATIELVIDGTLVNGRMEGTMTPVIATSSRFEGSWNLTPIL